MQRFRVILLVLFSVLLSCNANKQTPPAAHIVVPAEVKPAPPLPDRTIHRLDSMFTRVLHNYRFNGNVLVAVEGYPIFRSSHGFADLYTKDSLNINTAFQLASVSKAFTATSVLLLAQRGMLRIDDTVQHYMPDFPFPRITIKQLMQHCSGMQNYMYFVDHYWDKEKHITNEDVLRLINEHNPSLNFTPGRRHHYNNTGYAILALLVERVSGMPFHEFLRKNIFDPLNMDHTFAWNQKTIDTISNIATGFTRRGWRYRKFSHDPLDEVLGDKSVYSTVDDMLKWDQSFYSNVLICDSLRKQAFTKTRLRGNRVYNYGYGWRLREINGKHMIYHNGLWNGFTSSLSRYVDEGWTIILLNNTNAPAASIVRQLHNILVKELENTDTDLASAEK